MRIVSVCRSFGNGGGMENVVEDRADALRALGHDVHVIAAADGNYSDAFAQECADQCDTLAPDLIHLDSFESSRMWWDGRSERVALTLHASPWSHFFTKWNTWVHMGGKAPGMSYDLMKKQCAAIARADVVIAISRYEQGVLHDLCNVPDAKCVYNPIAPYFFSDTRMGADAGYFLGAGDTNVRGFDVARDAAALIGAEFRHVQRVPRRTMPAIYDACTAMVLPTVRPSGYDLTVAESLARGKPVITSKVGPQREDVLPGMVLVPIRDVDAVAEAMRNVGSIQVPNDAANRFRPERHAEAWLEAVT